MELLMQFNYVRYYMYILIAKQLLWLEFWFHSSLCSLVLVFIITSTMGNSIHCRLFLSVSRKANHKDWKNWLGIESAYALCKVYLCYRIYRIVYSLLTFSLQCNALVSQYRIITKYTFYFRFDNVMAKNVLHCYLRKIWEKKIKLLIW